MSRVHFRHTPFGIVISESGPAPLVAELKGDEAEQFRKQSSGQTPQYYARPDSAQADAVPTTAGQTTSEVVGQ
jgi:hypothetical protein